MFRRSPKEIWFRLRQELANAKMLVSTPEPPPNTSYDPLIELPDPAIAVALASQGFRKEVTELADGFLANRYPLLGYRIETGPDLEWRRDYVHGKTSDLKYFRRVPYLDFDKTGDHKVVWELNRHQHWVTLAQAGLLTGQPGYRDRVFREIDSWIAQNPFVRGINWTSALEVAFRAISWIWVYHLIGRDMPAGLRKRFLDTLFHHGWFLEFNLSWYFSPNTHLLGELIAVHALGVAFPAFPGAERWRKLGRHIPQLIQTQLAPDGGYFEQSSYYHVYALDMFLFHTLFAEVPPAYLDRIRNAARLLQALLGPQGELASFGDDDGGRFFHPWGPKLQFGRATLATASVLLGDTDLAYELEDLQPQANWWLGRKVELAADPPSEIAMTAQHHWFPDSGLAIYSRGDMHLVFKPGPMGRLAGHSHADLNSIILRDGEEALLIDPGTHNYCVDPKWRNWFRGTTAHNTVRAGGRDQCIPKGPFHWEERPAAVGARSSESEAFGECEYGGFRHRRRIRLMPEDLLLVEDTISWAGAPAAGDQLVEQFWHFGEAVEIMSPGTFRIGSKARLHAPPGTSRDFEEGREYGWRSPVYGILKPGFALRVSIRTALPVRLVTVIDMKGRYDSFPGRVVDQAQ